MIDRTTKTRTITTVMPIQEPMQIFLYKDKHIQSISC